MNKIVFIAKTDINTDGRILNELNILQECISDLKVDFILLPDKKVTISFDDTIDLHQIHTKFRSNKLLKPFTVLEFTLKAFNLLRKLKPQIIHAQDTSIILPVFLYKILNPKKFYLIYDDHELPNENEPFLKKIMDFFENTLIKKADTVIFANKERMLHLKEKLHLTNNLFYFLNLPYNGVDSDVVAPSSIESKLKEIDLDRRKGTRFIVHQGPLKIERGRQKLADFSRNLPKPYKVLLLGGTESDFITFKSEHGLPDDKFHFIGRVNYEVLSLFWKKGIASIVMYLPTYINNRLCAPNRLYLSYFMSLPILVNRDNPVLFNFVDEHNAGGFIEDYIENPAIDHFEQLNKLIIDDSAKVGLMDSEKNKIKNLYLDIIK